MLENTDQKNFEYGHFLRSDLFFSFLPVAGYTYLQE